jgi:hypothetical protein
LPFVTWIRLVARLSVGMAVISASGRMEQFPPESENLNLDHLAQIYSALQAIRANVAIGFSPVDPIHCYLSRLERADTHCDADDRLPGSAWAAIFPHSMFAVFCLPLSRPLPRKQN